MHKLLFLSAALIAICSAATAQTGNLFPIEGRMR